MPELPEVEALTRFLTEPRRRPARRAVRARGHRRAQDRGPAAVVARGPRRRVGDPAGEVPVHGPRPPVAGAPPGPGGMGPVEGQAPRRPGPPAAGAPWPCAWGSTGGRGSTSPRWGPRSAWPCGSSATPRRSRGSPPSASTPSTRPSTPTPWRALLAAASGNVKTVLAAQSIIAGIGNAYSDEILHVARLSPYKAARNLDRDRGQRLHRRHRRACSPTRWTAPWVRRRRSSRATRSGPCACTAGPARRAPNVATWCARCRSPPSPSSTAPPVRPGANPSPTGACRSCCASCRAHGPCAGHRSVVRSLSSFCVPVSSQGSCDERQ